jgi:hypothetical protein
MYCSDCKEECYAHIKDDGVGFTEYTSIVTFDLNPHPVSTCCNSVIYKDLDFKVAYKMHDYEAETDIHDNRI